MQVDEAYADYVAARWSMLYRLAALLVGHGRADELAGAALVRAYLSWPRGREHDLADEHVKAILARGALSVAPEPAEVDEPASLLGHLPRRERVVVVLRCFELRSGSEVAGMLGCGHDAVERDLAAGLRSLATTESELSTALAHEADRVAVPLPPIETLLAGAHDARRRGRRRALRLWGAAAVVLALALATGSYLQAHPIRWSTPPPMPTALADLTTGKPPRTTYAEGDTLHLDGGRSAVLEGNPTAIADAGRWTYVSFSSGTVVRVDNRSLSVVTTTDLSLGPVVTDQRGRYAAWVDPTGGLPRVVVRPTDPDRTHTAERTQVFPSPSGPDDPLTVLGLTPSGDVVAGYPTENRTWVSRDLGAGAELHQIEGLGNGGVHQVTPTEIAVLYPPTHFAVGRLAHDAFLADEDVVAAAADFGDPRARRIVYADTSGIVHVGRRGSGTGSVRSHDPRLRLPRLASGWSGLAWEDDDHVLLDLTDASMPDGALVRCDVRSEECEIAVRFHGPHLLAQ